MMFLSVVPGIGAALVWMPACLFLLASGNIAYAIGLAVFCSLLVGSVDNILRPKLVGNDTQLHELMIFFSTLGGLLTFGFSGFIIGPIIAALFVTVWEIYGVEFKPWLPKTAFISDEQKEKNRSHTQDKLATKSLTEPQMSADTPSDEQEQQSTADLTELDFQPPSGEGDNKNA